MENPSSKGNQTLYKKPYLLRIQFQQWLFQREFWKDNFKGFSNMALQVKNLSKLGPSFLFIAKFRGHLRQVQHVTLVNKIDEDRTAKKNDPYTTGQNIYRLQGKPKFFQFNSTQGEGDLKRVHISARHQGLLCTFFIKPFLALATKSIAVSSFKALAVLFPDCQK